MVTSIRMPCILVSSFGVEKELFSSDSLPKKVEKVAHFVFSLLKEGFQGASYCLKKVLHPLILAFGFSRVNHRMNHAVFLYQQKQFSRSIEQFHLLLQEKNLSDATKADAYVKMGKCFRRLAKFNEAKYYWDLAKKHSSDARLNKLIEHKLIKLEVLASAPLIQLDPSRPADAWEIVASRTFCEKSFTLVQRKAIIHALMRLSQNPHHQAFFELAAKRAKMFPDTFNILILIPETLKRYYPGTGEIKGFYNSKNSIAIKMDPNFGFTRIEEGCFMHELAHLGAMIKYHSSCQKRELCYCNPYPCSDARSKDAFEIAERKMLVFLTHALKSLNQRKTPNFNAIQRELSLEKRSKEELLIEISASFKQLAPIGRLTFDEYHVIETILAAYNLSSSKSCAEYSYHERHSELFARVEQLRVEINNPRAFQFIAPLCEYLDQLEKGTA